MFFRSRVAPSIVEKAYETLVQVAIAGIPIYLVPGNHERSKLPGHLWLAHRHIHVFNKPKTYLQKVNGTTIALSGFPFTRQVKVHFRDLLHLSRYSENGADLHLLCMHQTVEGAQVGPSDFTFRVGLDNIPGSDIPAVFDVVLSGHIHRSQRLTHTLDGQPLHAPVIYPGSIERTSFAERYEEKHFVIIKVESGSKKPIIEFRPLPARPMAKLEVVTDGLTISAIMNLIGDQLVALDPDSIVRIQLRGANVEELQASISAGALRAIAPPTMNISLANNWISQNR